MDKKLILPPHMRREASQREIISGLGSTPIIHTGGLGRRTAASVTLSSPEVRNPLLNIVNFYLPQNYKVLNQWIRYYDKFNELVGNCIDAHGEYPISKFHFEGIDDKSILRFFEEVEEQIDLFNFLLSASREYELIGEVFPFAHWNVDQNAFDKIIILNPDYVAINTAYLSYANKLQLELEPDEDLKRIVHSSDIRDIELKKSLDPIILRSVELGQNIPIDSFSVAQIARKQSPYDPRGTSIVMRALKTLLYDDKLIEAQYAIADGHINPKQIYKLGDPQNGYMPSDEDLDDFRKLLNAGAHDPLFAIVTHYGLQVEYVGAAGKILPIIPERQYNEERILTALYTNKAVMKGEGPGFSSGPQVAFQYLQGRYMSKRQKLERYLDEKIFTPIAIANGFYKKGKSGDKELIKPKLVWDQKLDLVEDQGRRQFMASMRDRLNLSFKTFCEVLNIDPEDEKKRLDDEKGTSVDPVEIDKYRNSAKVDNDKLNKVPGGSDSTKAFPAGKDSPSTTAPKQPGTKPLTDQSQSQKENKPQVLGEKKTLKISRASLLPQD